ncbi:MAG: CCA tRNA nucleotidyltransferase [uncultured Phycisphaerae bacterium]|uniref:CCA tRNA nucleotidyltransferase n=1 Tax=uncultured Phycisphaerae bacterium TaxID=904963 RepID=A0A6J4PMI1_9BACT|nr:MAG: CCA tRNA nucleotidyltransferase [uncultured Phycisphaerae bacterium]
MSETPTPPSRSPDARADALAVVRRLRGAGHVAYFAGGCVRDALLGLTPKDYDVATDAPPPRVRELFPRTQAVGAAFGVILVRQGRSQVEVATFRTDLAYVDGRRPEGVVFTTAEEDAKRRDFTINGMFYDPVEDQLVDHVGGRADLESRRLRAIGEADRRFEEDHLRMLRAVRFASRFGFDIEPATAAAIRRHAGHLKRISPERIADELRRMLTPTTRTRAWDQLWALSLLPVVFRELSAGDTPAARVPQRCLFRHVAPDEPVSFGTALAAGALTYLWQAAHDDADIEGVLARAWAQTRNAVRHTLKPSNEETDEMEGIWAGLLQLLSGLETVAARKRFLQRPTAPATLRVARGLAALDCDRERLSRLDAELRVLAEGDYAPPPLITGDDLTASGLRPGPVFKRVLDAVYDAQLEGRLTSREEAMALAQRVASGR